MSRLSGHATVDDYLLYQRNIDPLVSPTVNDNDTLRTKLCCPHVVLMLCYVVNVKKDDYC